MHPWYVAVEREELRRLYVDERHTTTEIAARLGCGPTTIRRRLDRFDIAARSRGTDPVRWLRRRDPGLETRDIWSPAVAYAVGLMATDGNLSGNGRNMTLSSKDVDLLETFRQCLGLRTAIAPCLNGRGTQYWRVQWSDRRLYKWLLSIGLTPAKSLTLGPLAIPDDHFADFFRGCIDGDGSIVVYTGRYHTAKNARYVYDRLYVSVVSASPAFVQWLQVQVRTLTGLVGAVGETRAEGRRTMAYLRFAKRESTALLRWMYHAPGVPALARKRVKAEPFLSGVSPEYP